MAENNYVVDRRKKNNKTQAFGMTVWLDKIKKIKKLDIIVSVGVISLILVFCIGSFTKSQSAQSTAQTTYENTYLQIEERLSEVLSKISGAGRVSVMINFAGTSELVTEKTSNTSTDKTVDSDQSGNRETESKTESLSPVIIQKNGEDSPLIIKEILPDIVGVIVVAEGAKNASVRINLLQAVQTLLSVSADKVEIFTMK